mgnify:CR=1 FL=1
MKSCLNTQEHKQILEVLANHWKYGKKTYKTVSVNFGLILDYANIHSLNYAVDYQILQ